MMNNQNSQPNIYESSGTINASSDSTENFQRNKNCFSLKTKATLLAIAIGVIPVATVGMLAYSVLNRSLTQEIEKEQLEATEIAADSFTRFMEDRIREVEALARDPLFTDARLRNAATLEEKTAVLDNYKDELEFYNSIVYFDPIGDPIFQAKSDTPNLTNYGGKGYFQEAVKTGKMTINGPGISSSSGQLRVEFAAPVKDRATGELIGVIRAKIPGNYINSLFEVYEAQNKHWHLINDKGVVFAGDRTEHLNEPIGEDFPGVEELHQAREEGVITSLVSEATHQKAPESSEVEPSPDSENSHQHSDADRELKLVGYVPAKAPARFPDLTVGTLLALDADYAFAPVKQLGLILLLGTATAAIVVAATAAYLADRATKPVIDAAIGVKKIGNGELDTRLPVKSKDELGELNANINLMTEQIQTSLQEQKTLAQEQRQEKEQLEQAISTLIEEIIGATDGDLTVRANLNSMQLSTVADLFNAIIDNLQEIAIEAKQSSSQVGSSLEQNERDIRLLAQQAVAEAEETRNTLTSVEQMSRSIQAVATNASQAEQIADDTYNTVLTSATNMDSTVDSILHLRNTVGETSKKMKRLGESSQKISQAVSFIEEIALRTNILAINATVEAGRAGEYGQGFTIVAEQVAGLAEQSAAATKEIAKIVAEIQTETQGVNQAMESGTSQVVETSRLLESTRESLDMVLDKSQTIDQLMKSISQSTVSQANTSRDLTHLIQKIAQLSETTSQSSEKVAKSIVETAQVAQKLESAVAQFKVARST